jgi:hypothetical protein
VLAEITGGKRGKSGIALVSVLQVQHFFGSLGYLFGPSHIVILDRDDESIILGNAAGKALEGSDSHNSSQFVLVSD